MWELRQFQPESEDVNNHVVRSQRLREGIHYDVGQNKKVQQIQLKVDRSAYVYAWSVVPATKIS
eukprot:scaffold539308_cov40-Prasinocladus_malaysianus.AAC.1